MRKVTLGAVAATGLAAAGVMFHGRSFADPQTVETTPAAGAVNERWLLDADGKQAKTGVSYLKSTDSTDTVKLRDRPAGTAAGQTTGFGILDTVDQGTKVLMKCWTQGSPGDGPSRRWFWLAEAPTGSPHPGETGYVWADLVWDQIEVPACTDAMTEPVDPLADAKVTLSRGAATTGAYFYTVALAGFPPGWQATVQCLDATDPYDVFHEFTLTVDSAGTAARADGCKSGDPGGHWVVVDGVESNKVNWSMTLPQPTTTTRAPSRTPPGDTPQTSTTPPPPARAIVVDNRVTNGATDMREDDVPAYLSTATRPVCRLNNCKVEGTEMSSGTTVTATCQTQGDRMTNGQDNSTVDDANPGLHTSSLWYGVRHGARTVFISEIFIRRPDRGGLNLPTC